ncbi:MAG TPA: polysaccharide biosynthesis/export family protein [Bacteroidia bacterium]|jgi:polysaccharide export outer membrane protein|nr:polysaccharide biosynthesis/export family protein [Bacteroidia bacterium]
MRKILFLFALTGLAGCELLYPSYMLKTPKDYHFDKLIDSTTAVNYKISPNDFLNMRLFSQDGFHIIDLTNTSNMNGGGGGGGSGSGAATAVNTSIDYLVEIDGSVKLPVIGRTQVTGLTIREATEMLEKKYSQYYKGPYILLTISNRRVIVFPGDPGTAKVIPLLNNNTTLIEALALAGGLTESGKAKEVKLIRGDPSKPQVYLIDLYNINGIKDGNTILQANDIIYVTPQRRPTLTLLERITPIIGGLSSILLTFVLIKSLKL